jgi:hypothetical protein
MARATAERLNVQLNGALDRLKQLADEKTRLASGAEKARDDLIAMINDLVQQVDLHPNQALSSAVLEQKLKAIREKTKSEFDRISGVEMVGD